MQTDARSAARPHAVLSARALRRASLIALPVVVAAVSLTRGWGPVPSNANNPGGVAPPPDRLVIHGFARDFNPSAGGFGLDSSSDPRLVADRMSRRISSRGLPELTGDGRYIDRPWTDRNGQTIAPHLASEAVVGASGLVAGDGLRLVRDPLIQSRGEILTWDFAQGPFDRARAGRNPQILTNQPMPRVDVPSVPRGSTVIVERGSGAALSSSIHVPDYMIRAGQVVTVTGDVSLVVDNTFIVETGAKIELEAGASLSIYGLGNMFFQTESQLNTIGADPSKVRVFSVGGRDLFFENNTLAYCTVVVPKGRLVIQDRSLVFASVTAEILHLQDASTLILAGAVTPPPVAAGCGAAADLLGAFSSDRVAEALGTDDVAKWFADVPGSNVGRQLAMVLERNEAGVYSIVEDLYSPINGDLYGNDDPTATFNSNFTWSATGTCAYRECGGQFIAAGGNGDWYIYVNGQLVVDYSSGGELGGQRIDMDRIASSMQLRDGDPIEVKLFYAQRGPTRRAMALQTNMPLITMREVLPPSREEYD